MSQISQKLSELYYTPASPGSYGGAERLYRAARAAGAREVTRAATQRFLGSQHAYTLHRPARRHYPRRKTVVSGMDQQWQADLVDMSEMARENKGIRYLMTVVDCFTRYAWAIPVRRKSGKEMAQAVRGLFAAAAPRRPRSLQTDKGREFYNKDVAAVLKEHGVHNHFSTHSDTKAAMVERFNRTLKQRMWTYFTAHATRKWLDVLPDLLASYNNSVHRATGHAPAALAKEKDAVHGAVWRRLYSNYLNSPQLARHIAASGDTVRISKQKAAFEKGYLPNWSEEAFYVHKSVPRPGRPVYKVRDMAKEDIKGVFYPEEVQPIPQSETGNVFEIERVLKKRTRRGTEELLAKWKGWPAKFNSWIPATEAQSI